MKLVSSTSFAGQALRHVSAVIITFSLLSQVHGQSPGSLDLTFDPTKAGELLSFASTPGDVNALALDPGGKLLLGGSFVGINGQPRPSIARINLDGALDAGFAPVAVIEGRVLALAVQPDGKLLVGGEFTLANSPSGVSLARFNPDGTLDTTFVADVKIQAGKGSVQALALQSDGRIIVGGFFDRINGVIRLGVARVDTNGAVDTSFNAGTLFINQNGVVHAAAVLDSGKLLIGGALGNQAVLYRLNQNGTLDPTFTNALTGWSVETLGVRTDKKIYVAGQIQAGGSWPEDALVLLNENGSRAQEFSALKAGVSSLQVQPNDRALVTGWFEEPSGVRRAGIARLNTDGTFDQGFDATQALGTNVIPRIPLAQLAADGFLWLSGQFALPDGTSTALLRLQPDGRLDQAFHSHAPPLQVAGRPGPIQAAVVLPGGEVLVGGTFDSVNNVPRANLARLLPNGLLDTTFQPQWSNGLNGVTTILPQPDGKFLVGGFGNFTNSHGRRYDTLVRMNPDGTLDPAFTPPWSETWYMRLHCLTLQPDGKILAGGEFENGLVRMNPDGTIDSSFHPPTLPAYDGDAVFAIVVQPDGKLIVGGSQTIGLFRLHPDGTPDPSFQIDPALIPSVHALAVQPNGMILVGGWLSLYCADYESRRLLRLYPDGTVDRTFLPAIGVDPKCILPLSDGRILVGGLGDYGAISSPLYCLFPDGTQDTNFTASVAVYLQPPSVLAIAIQPDARLLIGGIFSTVNRVPMEGLARLHNQLLPDAPKLAAGPVSLTRFIGQSADFAVQATGAPPLAFQWLFNDTPLPGQTNSGLTLGPLAPEHAGRYSLLVSNSIGTALSESASLTVFPVPSGPGSVDIGFDPTRGGKLLPLVGDWTGNSWEQAVSALALQPDGRLVIGGRFSGYNGTPRNNLARLHPDGRLDLTFDSSWGTDAQVNSIARQPDGKLIVAGYFNSIQGAQGRQLARLNADGTLDSTFNVSLEEKEEGPVAHRVWLQQDGKILLFGHFDAVNGTSRTNLARLNPDGSLDPSFNADYLTSPILAYITACELLADGRLLLGGDFPSVNRRFVRLNSDGTLDPTFITAFPGEAIYALAEQPDRKLVVCVGRERILRINPDGSLDPTFSPAQVAACSSVNSLGILWDGRILIGGSFSSVNNVFGFRGLALLNSNGTLDTTLDLPSLMTELFNLKFFILPDSTAIIFAQDEQPTGYKHLFYLLAPPNSFRPLFTSSFAAPNNLITHLLPHPDGKLVFSGQFSQFNGVPRPGLARLLADGTLDPSFYPSLGTVNYVACHALDPDGSIYITLSRPVTEEFFYERQFLGRLIPCGCTDPTFAAGGFVDIMETIVTPNSVVLQNDRKILVGGYPYQPSSELRPGVARFNSDGTPDSSFHPVPLPIGDDYGILSLGLQTNGKIILGGELTPARYLPNGDLDPTFRPGNLSGVVHNLIVQPDDSLLVSGSCTLDDGLTWLSLARLHPDGSLDPSLNPAPGYINAIARQPDRKILVAYQKEVVRLNPDGSLDPAFPAVKPNAWVRKIALQNDGRILLAGDFSAVNGIPAPGIARLNNLVYPVLRPCAPPAAQTFRLELTATPGIYSIQLSTNLQHWLPLATVTNDISGRSEFLAPSPPDAPQHFYRAVSAVAPSSQ